MTEVTNIQITQSQRSRLSEIQKTVHKTTNVPNSVTFELMLDTFEDSEVETDG